MSAPAARLVADLREHVPDERVLAAVASVPRERFVPDALRERAWENIPLPIGGGGQTISQPLVVARMCALLELDGSERVLDVGTGSGYHAALLARLARWVWSVEVHPELAARAEATLAAVGVTNVTVVVGDGRRGLPDHAPFDAINVAAAADALPPELEAQLAPGGRLVAPIARGEDDQHLLRVTRVADNGGATYLRREPLERVRFVPLV